MQYELEGEEMRKKEEIAKFIRGITVPPCLVVVLIIILVNMKSELFQNLTEVIVAVACLGIIPVLAYPLQTFLRKYRDGGREAQRNLAFLCNLIGFSLAVLLGYVLHVNIELQLMFHMYFLSVLLLTICNKGLHLRASGHACGVTGPLLLLIYFGGVYWIIPCVLLGIAIAWASLELRRHTKKELVMGSLVCLMAFFFAWGISLL